MAELTIMGPFEGPGEKPTCEYLAEVLPASWRVICNRKLPTNTADDVDIIVIGENAVFLVEEKSWGPKVVVGSHLWSVVKYGGKSEDRSNPFNSISTKSRKAATWLKNVSPELNKFKQFLTIPIVILSHPQIEILEKPGYKIPDNIFTLDESKEFFEFLDKNNAGSGLQELNNKITSAILDLDVSDHELSRIGQYEVSRELPSRKGLRVFEAEHTITGETTFLKCYSDQYWSSLGQVAESIVNREIQVMVRLLQTNRSWFHKDPFHFELKNWTVFPIVKPNGIRSIQELIEDSTLSFFKDKSLEICRDAFEALDEVHSENIAHKVLTPSRIWVGKGLKIRFSDFYLAHIDGDQSVVALEEDSSSVPFRDPEASLSLEFSDAKSDVYALSLSLLSWLTGKPVDKKDSMFDEANSAEPESLISILSKGLTADKESRWTARMLADALANLLEPSIPKPIVDGVAQFEVGNVISSRFEILEKLGSGGVATTWKVRDRYADGNVKVLKQLHDEDNYKLAAKEFGNANKLDHPGCSKTKEMHEKPSPGFLINEFIPGITLLEKSKEVGFGVSEARAISKQCLTTLGYIHQESLVHGDISPKNIIVGEDGQVTLIDFGFLASIGKIQQIGTPATLAPEVKSGKPLSPQSDIYSLGSTFVRILLGRQPNVSRLDSDGKASFASQPLSDNEIQQWGEDGAAFLEVLLKCSSPQPEHRYQSAQEVLVAIQKAVPTPVSKLPKKGSTPNQNPAVALIRSLYTGSSEGATNILGITSEFAKETYVGTRLDSALLPDILNGNLDALFLTGNPGDGKTSFLQQVQGELKNSGAEGEEHSWGWLLELNGRKFHAIFDASESHEAMSSDELVSSALSKVANGNYTALLAVNDGRLRQFFIENEEDFPEFSQEVERFFMGLSPQLQRFAIVDLKMRSLAAGDESQISSEILDTLTAPKLWEICGDCSSQPQCPAFANAGKLAGPSREKTATLLQISHLRRTKRATLRQIRSTFGYLITGDLSCDDVHQAVANNQDLSTTSADLGHLIFGGTSSDPLIQEWADFDPAQLVSPVVDRFLRSPEAPEGASGEIESHTTFMRNHFLGLHAKTEPAIPSSESSYYKYLDEYLSILGDPDDEKHKARIIKGVARLIGAYGYDGPNLAVSQARPRSDWSVLKPSLQSEFRLLANNFESPYVEFYPDLLMLRHESGAVLNISLDTAEVILGACDGTLFGDLRTDSIKFDIESFGKKLLRQLSDNLIVVEPSGMNHVVNSVDGKLIRALPTTDMSGD
jgi:serine/threonine protein kinase